MPKPNMRYTLALGLVFSACSETVDSAGVLDPPETTGVHGGGAAQASTADLSVTKTGPAQAAVGESLTWTIQVANAGPEDATGVMIDDIMSSELDFRSAAPSQGTCSSNTANSFTCDLGDLAAGAAATIDVFGRGILRGRHINTVSVRAQAPSDPDPTNNDARAEVQVGEGCVTLGFDDLGAHGDLVSSFDLLDRTRPRVAVTPGGPASAAEARLYDTDLADGPDQDLQWQNGFCAECRGQGAILVIAAVDFAAEGDSEDGGMLSLSGFDPGVWSLRSLKLIDSDRDGSFTVSVDGNTVGQTTIGPNGNVQTIDTGDALIGGGVVIEITESGAVDDVELCQLEP